MNTIGTHPVTLISSRRNPSEPEAAPLRDRAFWRQQSLALLRRLDSGRDRKRPNVEAETALALAESMAQLGNEAMASSALYLGITLAPHLLRVLGRNAKGADISHGLRDLYARPDSWVRRALQDPTLWVAIRPQSAGQGKVVQAFAETPCPFRVSALLLGLGVQREPIDLERAS